MAGSALSPPSPSALSVGVVGVVAAPPSSSLTNAELVALMTILGLDPAVTYDAAAARKLPYRRLAIVTDQAKDVAGRLVEDLEHGHEAVARAVGAADVRAGGTNI